MLGSGRGVGDTSRLGSMLGTSEQAARSRPPPSRPRCHISGQIDGLGLGFDDIKLYHSHLSHPHPQRPLPDRNGRARAVSAQPPTATAAAAAVPKRTAVAALPLAFGRRERERLPMAGPGNKGNGKGEDTAGRVPIPGKPGRWTRGRNWNVSFMYSAWCVWDARRSKRGHTNAHRKTPGPSASPRYHPY